MSFEEESIEHELTVDELLKMIVQRLDIIIKHSEIITDEILTEEDLNDDG